MKTLHIKNLEKYHPGYKDRSLIWSKTYFSMLNADPDFEMLCETDKWRFVAFTMLELQIKKPVLLDENYLIRKGFDFKSRKLDETLASFGDLSEVVDTTNVTWNSTFRHESVTQSRVEKSRVEKSRVEKKGDFILPDFINPETWNHFVAMRKQQKKPMSVHAMKLMVKKLQAMKDSGQDINAVIEQSILNSWQSVYEVKENGKVKKKSRFDLKGIDYSEGIAELGFKNTNL